MPDFLTLDELDSDGAIREAADTVAGDSRADFLRKAVITGGGLVGGAAALGALAAPAGAQTRGDVAILNFALTLEYLEAEFYTRAVASGALSGETLRFARVVRDHERAHVSAIKKVLGRKAVKKPRFNFKGTTQNPGAFRKTAALLELTGTRAYGGQAPRIDSTEILKAALAIHTVEARHTSWIRHIMGRKPAPVAFQRPLTKQQVLARVARTGFIVPARRRLTG